MHRRRLIERWIVPTMMMASVLLVPTAARADGFVTPFFGVNFAGATGGVLINAIDDSSRQTYGVSLGFMIGGVFGFEEDIAYAPKFVAAQGTQIGQTNVLTLMSNLVLGIPIGGQTGAGVRPYVLGGVGLLRTNAEQSIATLTPDQNSFGFDAGGGINIYFSDHVGIRGDLRYMRSFSAADSSNILGVILRKGTLDFWRGTGGLVLRF